MPRFGDICLLSSQSPCKEGMVLSGTCHCNLSLVWIAKQQNKLCAHIYIYCIYETVCYHGTHTLGNLKYCTLRNYQGGICLSQSIATSLINQKHAWSIPLHKINPHETGCMDNFFCQSFVGLDWSFEVFLSCQVVTDLDCLHGYSQRFWTVQFRKVLGLIFVG